MKLDSLVIEPLSEAFGQDSAAANLNMAQAPSIPDGRTNMTDRKVELVDKSTRLNEGVSSLPQFELVPSVIRLDDVSHMQLKSTRLMVKESGSDTIGSISARDVEQGMCAQFKRVETVNEKRSINEPKLIPVSIGCTLRLRFRVQSH